MMRQMQSLAVAFLSFALALSALAQPGDRASDLRYCAKLSDLYARYVGRSEAGPHWPVKPDVVAGVALAKCREGDAASAIPILERKLRDARFALPLRD
jgi:hypothetical protein